MDQIIPMFEDLKTCYRLKVPSADDYVKLKESEKNSLCLKLREKIINHLQSDNVLFENHLRNVVENLRSNKFIYKIEILK
jgi:hypothetical protein